MSLNDAIALAKSLCHEECMDLLLMQDPAAAKIQEDSFRYYTESSIRMGKEAANAFLTSCGAQPGHIGMETWARLCAETCGVRVQYVKENSDRGFGLEIAANTVFEQGTCTVVLNEDLISEKYECTKEIPEIGESGVDQMLSLHLAHEYFHCLEYLKNGRVYRLLKPARKAGFLGIRECRIRAASEIAAHTFANEVMKPAVPPPVIDYLTMLRRGELSPEVLEELITNMRRKREKVTRPAAVEFAM